MKARVSKLLLFSKSFKSLSRMAEASNPEGPPVAALLSRLSLPSPPNTHHHYSSVPNRPVRGEGRDDRSEDHFLRNLNFGNHDDDENTKKTQQDPPSHIPNRPLRGETRLDDIFPNDDDDEKMNRAGRSTPSRIPNRSIRGERREGAPLRQRSNLGGDYSGGKFVSSLQNSPVDLAGKSLSEGGDPSGGFSIRNLKLSDHCESSVGGEKRGDHSEGSLLQKLKFGKKEGETHQDASIKTPETADSTLPDSSSSPQDADEIFRKMKETGLIPNAVAMLDGLCKDGLIQEAMKLFGLMREKGTIPEVVIYTAVVEGFCKAAKFDDADRIFKKMKDNGILPNAFSYKVLIQGLCKGKRLVDAVEFCLEMLDAGHAPSVVTFTGLVDVLCTEKGVEEAESVIRRLCERGFVVDGKAVREHLDKKGPFSPLVWEAIFGKKSPKRPF